MPLITDQRCDDQTDRIEEISGLMIITSAANNIRLGTVRSMATRSAMPNVMTVSNADSAAPTAFNV